MDNRRLVHNVLLDEARRQYRHSKYQQLAAEARAALTQAETSAEHAAKQSVGAATADGSEAGSAAQPMAAAPPQR